MNNLAQYIDHTLLKPTATEMDFRKLCEEIYQHRFYAACVPPHYVSFVKDILVYSEAKVCTVIGFPLGYNTTATKLAEAEKALADGADELDMVMNINAFKSMAYITVKEEIKALAEQAHSRDAVLKVIIETAYLDNFDLSIACEICEEAGADFVKTSTGFAPKGADLEQVKILRQILPENVKIKASGGIQTYEQAIGFIEAGAARLGTSAGVAILKGLEGVGGY
ncbi:deoxyribose-phosphate aldolase [Emticicia sp. 21SJ11W-3]|uniref:deoxyribose-phosphate aldolase n=1 Tax=Emticicia sp. 21SJ11W-3 TaxID=2916755 RepID=UPI0020A17F06|nr:deoxyribose-phosphate aldolase [Emticicia sp. 21SJ11W-3]UTA67084.1 deoxyribose-phosphate aldolase [Emticicia sp. 21SJ11W-3]